MSDEIVVELTDEGVEQEAFHFSGDKSFKQPPIRMRKYTIAQFMHIFGLADLVNKSIIEGDMMLAKVEIDK